MRLENASSFAGVCSADGSGKYPFSVEAWSEDSDKLPSMENFTIGYPGIESAFRIAFLNVLGKEKYDYFFDQYQYHWFTDADAKYFLSLGLNCLRLHFSHKHLDDYVNPRGLIEVGFKHIDRVIDICSRNGIYTALDMHTVPSC